MTTMSLFGGRADDVAGQAVLITGAANGIGAEVARRLAYPVIGRHSRLAAAIREANVVDHRVGVS